MKARSAGAIAPPHFSHPGFISSAMHRLSPTSSAAQKGHSGNCVVPKTPMWI
jgi:hypothetical protein